MHFLEYLKALERTLFEARADERAVDAVRVIILSDFWFDIGELHYLKASTSQLRFLPLSLVTVPRSSRSRSARVCCRDCARCSGSSPQPTAPAALAPSLFGHVRQKQKNRTFSVLLRDRWLIGRMYSGRFSVAPTGTHGPPWSNVPSLWRTPQQH